MARYIDIHSGFVGATEEQLRAAYRRQRRAEDAEGVRFERTWLDPEYGKVFCLCTAPSKEAVLRVHERAGRPAAEVYEVPIEIAEHPSQPRKGNPMTTATLDADRALKAKHRAIWASGSYETIVNEIVAPLGPILVHAAGVTSADRVLDVAAGTGSASIPAAETGARVVASDLTPELLEIGRRDAEARGLHLDWRTADAEALPFGDDEFDVVLSCIGVMFAPHHQAGADELIRVCRPGGTVSVLSWTPGGFIGQVFAAMKPYAPPPPPGAQPPPLWGDPDHVRRLFGDRVTDLEVRRQTLEVTRFGEPEDFVEHFKTHYGPTIATYRHIAGDPERVAALDRALAEVAQHYRRGTDRTVLDWEYLVVTARKR